jgi:maltooligosyltrehalose trehalohydrolase
MLTNPEHLIELAGPLVGPAPAPEGYAFTVWAPGAERVELAVAGRDPLPMEHDEHGYWRATDSQARAGDDYEFILHDGKETLRRGDPAAHEQPDIHGVSRIVDHAAFQWTHDDVRPAPPEETVIYELHIGTFTNAGTFQAAVERLPHLVELGVTAVEVMPVAQFPGGRNWGYDGVFPYAVQTTYGGPLWFKRFVDECHGAGLAVILDVVYNHLGPEGNYLRDFGPYFSQAYNTPWGEAINFDQRGSDGVRNYFIQNALHWFARYHVDALRLDATHAIYDARPLHVLSELAEATAEFRRLTGRDVRLIAESDKNDPALATPRSLGGHGLDAIWSDDLHHAVHARLTGERTGYFKDYGGERSIEHIADALNFGFGYRGQFSEFRGFSHGQPADRLPAEAHVVCIQNHDQVGNRMMGERLTRLVSSEGCKVAAALYLLSPYTPLIFMGEEWGEDRPFLYFISHTDPDLVEAVRKGRKREFEEFHVKGEPPDAQAESTFRDCILDWEKRTRPFHAGVLALYRKCLALRRELPALAGSGKAGARADRLGEDCLVMRRSCGLDEAVLLANLGHDPQKVRLADLVSGKTPTKLLDTASKDFDGPGETMPHGAHGYDDEAVLPGESAVLYRLT